MTTNGPNEQKWLQLFADHPNLICVVWYILHSSDLDYYFIYTSLHNAVLQSNIMFIEGDIAQHLIDMLVLFETDNPVLFQTLKDAFNSSAIVIPPKLICTF